MESGKSMYSEKNKKYRYVYCAHVLSSTYACTVLVILFFCIYGIAVLNIYCLEYLLP